MDLDQPRCSPSGSGQQQQQQQQQGGGQGQQQPRQPPPRAPPAQQQGRGARGGAPLDDEFSDDDDCSSLGDDVEQGPPDPLYDEEQDDADAAWVAQQRQGRESDAILSCPGCFTTLCIDCQQHDSNPNQFRAMFVTNCRVDTSRAVHATGGGPAGRRKRSRGGQAVKQEQQEAGAAAAGEALHPVACDACGTDVGVLDPSDGVYHFLHAFPSHA